MGMYGIDVSNWDGWTGSGFGRSNTEKAYGSSKFVICKATQGSWYVNPLCDTHYQRAKKDGKLLGVYHYAEGTDPEKEAKFFYDNIKGYIKEAIPCLDWEKGQNASWGSTSWAWSFAKEFHALSGVWPLIYVQASAISQVKSCASKCGLWVAGYPDNRNSFSLPSFPYSISPWSVYTIWQFSSSGGQTDRNYANLTAATWKKIANPNSGTTSSEPSEGSKPKEPTGSTLAVACDTMKGKYGNGDTRKKNLGSRYDEIQGFINHVFSASAQTLANEVLAGKYGNGETRKVILGDRYAEVQAIVNGKIHFPRTYIVVSGDTLSGIGAKLGVNWQTIAGKNGIKSPYTIYPGQKLKY